MIPSCEQDENGKIIRIPHSGFVHENIEYTLVGFGKLDKRIYTIPQKIEEEAKKLLGTAAQFRYTQDMKQRLSTALKATAWKEIKEKFQALRATGNYGPVQAFQAALEPPEQETKQSEEFGAY